MTYVNINMREHKLRELPTAESIQGSFERTCTAARKVFHIHKEVVPMFIIFCLDGPSHCPAELVIPAPWHDTDEKHAYYSFVRKMAGDTKGVAVMMFGECWFSEVVRPADFDEKKVDLSQFRPASEDPDRKEIVHVVCASTLTQPRNQTQYAYIHRPRGKKPFLGPWETYPEGNVSFAGNLFDLLPATGS